MILGVNETGEKFDRGEEQRVFGGAY